MAMGMARWMIFAVAAGVFSIGLAPVEAAAPTRAMKALHTLESGKWELRRRGARRTDPPAAMICLGDPVKLLQPRQGDGQCAQFVIEDSAERAVITYQCPGNGTGRTDLRVETSRLVQIDTQGIDNGAPFSDSWEARQVGSCR